MRHNLEKTVHVLKPPESILGWRVHNMTDYEVLLDVVLCRNYVEITIKDVYKCSES